jgi:AraC-like DNA-binding protein
MTEIHLDLTETSVDGSRTVRWELNAADCLELSARRISRLGIHHAEAPYRRVRVKPSGSFVLACFEGEGCVLLDGRWQTVRSGTICMAPPRVLNAFHVLPGKRWGIAWVRFHEPSPVTPLVNASSPLRVQGDADGLRRILEGIRAESGGARGARALHHWIELLMVHVGRLTQPWHLHERLWSLWEIVGKNLAADWTLDALARQCHYSPEQLRRLCLRELGRSPMQHLTYMRMQRAQELLESSNDKLEVVAASVGYESAIVFSRAFKRWIGRSPSEYRRGR